MLNGKNKIIVINDSKSSISELNPIRLEVNPISPIMKKMILTVIRIKMSMSAL